ncbi:hypothetical protein [Leptolyngbya sp. FACHB-711]|uniref:hypothetical protein n=1 Tax=Leptolyngbya sp. FACHB-711 TaxID=2692813 RepID=UPI0016831FB5|nr:hypothetical protein [Leptolyngbya sp. FACHB-711]MBD1852685.1 hypothetical protein [Cyanobacteria bacterium FACHB-502]MBD2025275.1 hypothetical protein [Leptolyngbya sp. FACHB-711]
MRTQKQWLEYKQLEQIPLTIAELQQVSQDNSGHTHRLSDWLRQIWRPISRMLESTTEPHIWKTYDQMGNPIWHAHDPITGQESEWISEDDLRVWLEERYYQPVRQPLITSLEQR